MAEPIPVEIRKGAFRAALESVQRDDIPTPDWPDDPNDTYRQGVCIRRLIALAETPEVPFASRSGAHKALLKIARIYYEGNVSPSCIPKEMISWCLGIVLGTVKPPSRGPGRLGKHRLSELGRNALIAAGVARLIDQGEIRTTATTRVGDIVGLSCNRVDSMVCEVSLDRARYISQVARQIDWW